MMGAEYYIIKENPKEKFELGKANWFCIFDYSEQKLSDRFSCEDELLQEFLKEIAQYFSDDTTIGYFRELSEEIFNWCGDSTIQLKIDCSFDDSDSYTQTGTRYTGA